MEKGQSDVTEKIRTAIKKKLVDINAFVDDELPEYIMILVANKRSKAHIEKDLSLFLGNDTVNFTNWLCDLLNSLKSGIKSSSSILKKEVETSRKKEPVIEEDTDVLDYDPDEQEGYFLYPDDTNESTSSKSSAKVTHCELKLTDEAVEPVPVSKVHSAGLVKITNEDKDSNQKSTKAHSTKQVIRTLPSSTVIPMKQKSLINSADEYDPDKPGYVGSISSVVCVSQRKYGGSAALQANKLLLRAVDDATKSVLDGKSLSDFYKPTPIKMLASKKDENVLSMGSNNSFKVTMDSEYDLITHRSLSTSDSFICEDENDCSSMNMLIDENYESQLETVNKNRTICITTAPHNTSHSNIDEMEIVPTIMGNFSVEDERSKSPHFFVTLEGVNFNTFKRKHIEETSIESIEEDEEDTVLSEANVSDSVPEKKQKLNERCKYWPACKNSDHCVYHHPTTLCKCFPDCKYGDKCLYIHPNCKFDALCSRKDCPYTHASRRKLPLAAAVPVRIQVKSRKVKPVCKFYPKCTSKKCPFIHPKLCRYGTECRSPKCIYSHFQVPSRNQMKWQASIS